MTSPMPTADLSMAIAVLEEAIRAMEEAERTRQEFVARMSHELRTPLNAVIGFSRVLEKNRAGNQRPEDLEMLRSIGANGASLLQLVENVLDQSLLDRNALAVEIRDVDPCPIAQRVVDAFRSAAAAKGLRLLAVIPERAAPVQLDPLRFEQVVRHLVDNAVKFTASGTIRVALLVDADTNRPSRLTVADNGVGIHVDHLGKVFLPFEQVDGSMRRVAGGAGLGLALAQRYCAAMNCSLSVESKPQRGSRFTVRFPQAENRH